MIRLTLHIIFLLVAMVSHAQDINIQDAEGIECGELWIPSGIHLVFGVLSKPENPKGEQQPVQIIHGDSSNRGFNPLPEAKPRKSDYVRYI